MQSLRHTYELEHASLKWLETITGLNQPLLNPGIRHLGTGEPLQVQILQISPRRNVLEGRSHPLQHLVKLASKMMSRPRSAKQAAMSREEKGWTTLPLELLNRIFENIKLIDRSHP